MSNLTIAEYGGKTGLYSELKEDKDFKEYLPEGGVILMPGQDPNSILDEIIRAHGKSRKLIVRAGHRDDTTGLVDVLTTYPVNNVYGVSAAVKSIRLEAASEAVTKYYGFESGRQGVDLADEISILVQPFISGKFLVQMVAHPHVKDFYVIERRYLDPSNFFSPVVAIVDNNLITQGVQGEKFGNDINVANSQLVALYIKLRSKLQAIGAFGQDDSLHLEIGERKAGKAQTIKHTLFQVRRLKSYEQSGDFEVAYPNCVPYLSFGVTLSSGINVILTDIRNLQNQSPVNTGFSIGYFYEGSSAINVRPDISIMPSQMSVYVAQNASASPLDHGHLAYMQRAPISVVYRGDLIEGKYILVANGINACLTKIR
ncbi:MAG: hypothetical protein UR28_C0036G0010 [Candidatus Peregrinibacteria bacterium GW2011_GWF2_33_10]|nr:MAG: hypothetical protein UR28_C0036G0010 [Candidatus Peregrinibacteria bacterium GW2011_GWF2_33_10]OGJ43949.1 MAG: hypothetical protein A2272_04970 [Candidatus Peregrinibacteria bacterium RIFOXYA12_FULL_33_12]OGJ46030.1 MAG: hypothetical protein A2263_03365 [Candidatus Peregrinibacteria bacterium RIFOXYA2_FULL_33_21]OGJ51735.1 MAG: hypothetical protein A2307_04395 [Candidatus Peregrinibacteria bacterium RIFOXYB2_FULL_33_20]